MRVYTLLIQGLAASLRVSDALSMINGICQVGVSPSEEVSCHCLSKVFCLSSMIILHLAKIGLYS